MAGFLDSIFGSGSSNKATTPTSSMTSTPFVDPTLPGRIPVSTGVASSSGSITSRPSGVSNADWTKYQSLTGKLDPSSGHGPISAKNQAWYDAFLQKYGSVISPPAGGGGGPGGTGGTPGLPASPPGVMPDVGLLTRPYSNPFEQRNLWNLFPNGVGPFGQTSGGVRG